MPPEKRTRVLTLVEKKLSLGHMQDPKQSITNPLHAWLLPPRDLQCTPYVPLLEQRVTRLMKQTAEQRVDDLPPVNIPPLTRISNAPPIMAALNPTQNAS